MSITRWVAAAFTVVAAAGVVGAAEGTAAAAGGDLYGAIAISFETGRTAYAVNYPTPAEAGRAADAYCGGGPDCSAYVYFVNACGAAAEAPDGSVAWAWGVDLVDAEQSAINSLGLRAPKFPSTGSAFPAPAHILVSACTDPGGPSAPGGHTLPAP